MSIRYRVTPETFKRLKESGEKSGLSPHQYARELTEKGLEFPDLPLFMAQQVALSNILNELLENQQRLIRGMMNMLLILIPQKWDMTEEETRTKIEEMFRTTRGESHNDSSRK